MQRQVGLNDAEKVVIYGDTHIPDDDRGSLNILYDFIKDWKPSRVIHVGDLGRFDQVSTYPHDKAELSLGREFAKCIEHLDRFGVTDMNFGNHEQRLLRPGLVSEDVRDIYDPVRNLKLEDFNINWRPYDSRPNFGGIRLRKLLVIHGFGGGGVNSAADHSRVYGCVAFGHSHRMAIYQPNHALIKSTAFNIGCMCKMDQAYNITQPPAAWVNGFMFLYLFRSGNFSPYLVRIVGDEIAINDRMYSK